MNPHPAFALVSPASPVRSRPGLGARSPGARRGWMAWVCLLLGALAALWGTNARAHGQAVPQGLQAQVEGLLQQPLSGSGAAANAGQPWRVEISLGQLDPRIRLAPCDRVKAYLPQGASLWGRTRVGLRCEQGPVRWNVYWPVQVKVWAKALVAAVPLRAGGTVSAADVHLAEVDLAASDSAALQQPSQIVGRTLARAVAVGQSLRQDDLKARRWFAPGDPVRLRVKGPGFMVGAEGVALAPGDEGGRCARVRTEQGRILCGQPVGERLVEVTL